MHWIISKLKYYYRDRSDVVACVSIFGTVSYAWTVVCLTNSACKRTCIVNSPVFFSMHGVHHNPNIWFGWFFRRFRPCGIGIGWIQQHDRSLFYVKFSQTVQCVFLVLNGLLHVIHKRTVLRCHRNAFIVLVRRPTDFFIILSTKKYITY